MDIEIFKAIVADENVIFAVAFSGFILSQIPRLFELMKEGPTGQVIDMTKKVY